MSLRDLHYYAGLCLVSVGAGLLLPPLALIALGAGLIWPAMRDSREGGK